MGNTQLNVCVICIKLQAKRKKIVISNNLQWVFMGNKQSVIRFNIY